MADWGLDTPYWVTSSYSRQLQALTADSVTVLEIDRFRDVGRDQYRLSAKVHIEDVGQMFFELPYKDDGTNPLEELAAMINLVAP